MAQIRVPGVQQPPVAVTRIAYPEWPAVCPNSGIIAISVSRPSISLTRSKPYHCSPASRVIRPARPVIPLPIAVPQPGGRDRAARRPVRPSAGAPRPRESRPAPRHGRGPGGSRGCGARRPGHGRARGSGRSPSRPGVKRGDISIRAGPSRAGANVPSAETGVDQDQPGGVLDQYAAGDEMPRVAVDQSERGRGPRTHRPAVEMMDHRLLARFSAASQALVMSMPAFRERGRIGSIITLPGDDGVLRRWPVVRYEMTPA